MDFIKSLKERMTPMQALAFGLAAFFVIAGFVFAFLTRHTQERLNAETLKNERKAKQLEVELGSMQAVREDAEGSRSQLRNASKAGQDVAGLQTDYARLSITEDEALYVANANSMSAYLDSGSANYRTEWMHGASSYKWSFCTTYSFSDERVPVLWLCHDGDRLLGYALGVYNADTGLFSDMEVHTTTYGNAYGVDTDGERYGGDGILTDGSEAAPQETVRPDSGSVSFDTDPLVESGGSVTGDGVQPAGVSGASVSGTAVSGTGVE